MEDTSLFMDKAVMPTENALKDGLGSSYSLWKQIHDMVFAQYPDGKQEWNFPGKKYGWSYRMKDKKRAIIYLLPGGQSFKVAFVFGDKALAEIMESPISEEIKTELQAATKYAEGRGIRIDVKDSSILTDIDRLIEIKLRY